MSTAKKYNYENFLCFSIVFFIFVVAFLYDFVYNITKWNTFIQ